MKKEEYENDPLLGDTVGFKDDEQEAYEEMFEHRRMLNAKFIGYAYLLILVIAIITLLFEFLNN